MLNGRKMRAAIHNDADPGHLKAISQLETKLRSDINKYTNSCGGGGGGGTTAATLARAEQVLETPWSEYPRGGVDMFDTRPIDSVAPSSTGQLDASIWAWLGMGILAIGYILTLPAQFATS
jgi:hypothetical protein